MAANRDSARGSTTSSIATIDIPPFPISLLNSLMPTTKCDSSTNWLTFSEGFRLMNGPSAALGITDSSAAATSFSMLN